MNKKESSLIANNTLEVSWQAIRHNLEYFRRPLSENTCLTVMLKADAYGMGAIVIAKKIEEEQLADSIGIAQLKEGIELRKAGISLPIIVFNPLDQQWEEMLQYSLEPMLYSLKTLRSFRSFLANKKTKETAPYPIHIEFNTGMNRLGFEAESVEEVIKELQASKDWKVKSLMTHLSATGNKEEDSYTQEQIEQLNAILKRIRPELPTDLIIHSLNSNGIERFSHYHFDMVRLGIGIYGASALPQLKASLAPICRLVSTVADIRVVRKGASIGYNRSGKAVSDTQIATLSIGYADGFPRKLGNGNWQVEIKGKLYPTIGNICMDLCMIDVGNDPIEASDSVLIFGGQKDLFSYAEALETISYEALTSVSSRVERRLLERFH